MNTCPAVKLDPLSLSVREAGADDSYEMWVWWNDPVTRAMMKLNGYVPWEQHSAWFDATLSRDDRLLLMVVCRHGKIGVLRYDRKDSGTWETSIHFNPLFRGQGLGGRALELGRARFLAMHPGVRLFATLKQINTASRRSFEKAAYVFGAPPDDLPGLERFDASTELFCLWPSAPITSCPPAP